MEEIVKNKEWILFGAGDEGRKLSQILKSVGESVYAFVDNDINKVGDFFEERKIISFNEMLSIHQQYNIVVSVSKKYEGIIFEQLENAGIKDAIRLEKAYELVKYTSIPNLRRFKNMYRGKRCFIIGTGPSLTVDDLNVLHNNGEIVFASNKIFKIFDQTVWRPDIYCVIDDLVIEQYENVIVDLPVGTTLIANYDNEHKNKKNNINHFRLRYKAYTDEEYPEFSCNPDRYVVEGFSVTYAIMQWAAYMGFEEMYLLGIDFDYGDAKNGYKHFSNDYDGKNEKVKAPRLDKCLRAYMSAEMYSRENGFRIYNATRGGKLEVFERVDFDKLFSDKE